MKKHSHTKKYHIDILIQHIASIFSIGESSELLVYDWSFLNELVRQQYLTAADLTTFKDIQILEILTAFYEVIVASFKTQLAVVDAHHPCEGDLSIHLLSLSATLR
jgi:hypothetical protein